MDSEQHRTACFRVAARLPHRIRSFFGGSMISVTGSQNGFRERANSYLSELRMRAPMQCPWNARRSTFWNPYRTCPARKVFAAVPGGSHREPELRFVHFRQTANLAAASAGTGPACTFVPAIGAAHGFRRLPPNLQVRGHVDAAVRGFFFSKFRRDDRNRNPESTLSSRHFDGTAEILRFLRTSIDLKF